MSKRTILVIVLAIAQVPTAWSSELATGVRLLDPANSRNSELLAPALSRRDVLQERHARLHLGALAGAGRVTAPLFPDLEIDIELTRRLKRSPSDSTWHGRVVGAPLSEVLFLVRDDRLTGIVRVGGRTIRVDPLGDGRHLVREIDPAAFDPCSTPELPSPFPPGPTPPPEAEDDGSFVDVLVLYTDDVDRNEVDPVASIQAVIDETNQVYERSGVMTRVRLVAAEMIEYDEPGSSATSLTELRSTDDGVIDEIHALRDRCGADAVSLWQSDLGGSCGRASRMTNPAGFDRFAFSVVEWWCALNNYSFAHELGHNQGCAHDRDNSSDALSDYAYGYALPGEFRTVMAYSCSPSCPRRGHFSNPNVDLDGLPTGLPLSEPEPAFNAMNINDTAFDVSNFRQSAAGCCDVDGFEAPDGCAGAELLLGGEHVVANHCDDDEDWFAFTACAGRDYSVSIDEQEPDSDLELVLLGADCGTVHAREDASGTGRDLLLEWTAPESGRYRVQLLSRNGAGSARSYRLTVTGNTSPCEPSGRSSSEPLRVVRNGDSSIASFENVLDETSYGLVEGNLSTWYGSPVLSCVDAWDDSGARVTLPWSHEAGSRWLVIEARNASGPSPAGRNSLDGIREDSPLWPLCP